MKAGQQTMSDRDVHLCGQTFALPVILTGHVKKRPEKKNHFHTITFLEDSHVSSSYVFLLVTRLVSSSYRAIFNIFTGQKRDDFELRLVWSVNRSLVNTTGNSPKLFYFLSSTVESRVFQTPREQQIVWNLSGGLRNRG